MKTAYNKALHQYALFVACCTFVLLNMGALVTSNDAGLSIPDWPLAYGAFVPPFVGGIRYEYSHRVFAGFVAILTAILAGWLWRAEKRVWMRWLGWAALGGVIAQAILGGLTVKTFQLPPVSAAHGTLAQIFFSTLVAIAVFTGSWWQGDLPEFEDPGAPRVRTLVLWTLAAVFCQLVLGAAFRHRGFGIVPHLVGAAVVTVLMFVTAGALKRRFGHVPALRGCARYLHLLIGLQLLLGAGAYWSRLYNAHFPQPLAVMIALTVSHTVTGALLLALTLVTTLICYRMIRASVPVPETAPASQQVAH
jgi:heme a synthase